MKKIILIILFGISFSNIFAFSLDNNSIAEESALNTVIGNFDNSKAEYTLVSGAGSEDNSKFKIVDGKLVLNFIPDFEDPKDLGDNKGNNTYSVRVKEIKNANLKNAKFPITYSEALNEYEDNELNENGDKYSSFLVSANNYPEGYYFSYIKNGSLLNLGTKISGKTKEIDTGKYKVLGNFKNIVSNARAFAALESDGSIIAWGYPSDGGSGAPTDKGYVKIYSTRFAFAALKSDGSIKSWGRSSSGGSGAPTDKGYVKIYSNENNFLAIKSDGSIKAWGENMKGKFGAIDNKGPVKIYSNFFNFAILKKDGSIEVLGNMSNGGLEGIPPADDYIKIYGNWIAFAALKSDGSIKAWGDEKYGGKGAPTDKGYIKIVATEGAFAALKSDGSIKAWGDEKYGGKGAPTDKGYVKIFSKNDSFAALKRDGSVVSWGRSLFNNSSTDSYAKNTPKGKGYIEIYVTQNKFLAINKGGWISEWGERSYKKIIGNYKKIITGAYSYIAIKDNEEIFCGTTYNCPKEVLEKEIIVNVIKKPDTIIPTITLNGNTNYTAVVGSVFTDPGAVCKDNIDSDKNAIVTSNLDTSKIGVYTISYSCKDSSGNEAILKTRTINIVPANTLNLKVKLPIQTVKTGMSKGFVVSNIITKNVPIGSNPVYDFAAGFGDEDNSKFKIEGNFLKLNFKPDFNDPIDIGAGEKNNSYSIRIKSVLGSSENHANFIIQVLPENIILNDKYKCKGYGWSQNIGWISLNCSETNSCQNIDYGTSFDNAGKLTGFAWTPNLGWLNHSPLGLANTVKIIGNSFVGNSLFNSGLEKNNDGWGGILSYKGNISGGGSYSVQKNNDGKLTGYAWGGNVVGWVGFPQKGNARCSNMTISFTTGQEKGLTPNTKLDENESLVLKWKTDGASSCKALGGEGTTWTDNENKSVSIAGEWKTESINNLKKNTNFTLECKDSSGNIENRNLYIFVKPPKPKMRFWATDTNIPYDTKAELNWEVENVSECKGTGSWSGSKNIQEGVHKELTSKLNSYPTYTFTLECKSDRQDIYGQEWFRQDILIDIAKLSVDIKAKRNPLPFNDPIEIIMDAEFAKQCKRKYTYVKGQNPLKPAISSNIFTKNYYNVSSDFSEKWKSENVKEKSVYKFEFNCKGEFGQEETKELILRVGNVPTFIEN